MRQALTRTLLASALAFGLVACDGEPDEEADEPREEVEEADDAEPENDEEPDEVTEPPGYDVEDQPETAAARFTAPADGDAVEETPVVVTMMSLGVDTVPAGEPQVGTGHLHVMVDVGCVEDGEYVPEDAQDEGYYHFGDGSTVGELDLEPGERELCVQLGDGVHQAFGETHEITITVE